MRLLLVIQNEEYDTVNSIVSQTILSANTKH